MKILYYLIVPIILFSTYNSTAQHKEELQKFYENKLNEITDSTVQFNKQFQDTIFLSMDTVYKEMIKDFYHYKDSLLLVYSDSLSLKRKDSVNFMSANLKKDFDIYYSQKLDSLNNTLIGFTGYLNQLNEINKNCPVCKNKDDYNDNLDDYRDLMDSVSGTFEDNYNTLSDTLVSMAGDSIEGCEDRLLDYTMDLLDSQTDENERTGKTPYKHKEAKEPASELDINVTYDSHDTYRGRDNGINQYSIAPSIQYQHKSGFGAYIDAKFLSKENRTPDDYDAGISWVFDISTAFNITLSYTHYWFNDSVQARATLNNTFESGFNLETKHYNSSLTLDIDFGGGVREFSSEWYNGLPLILSKKFLKGTLTFEPNITFYYGEQNSSLIALRKRKGGKIVPVIKKNSTF